MSSQLSPASSWSAFQSIGTNNDVEGWHNRLNQQARRGSSMSISLLHCCSTRQILSLQCILVSERRLRRHQRKRYARVQECLDMYWMAYSPGKMTSALLKKCSYVY